MKKAALILLLGIFPTLSFAQQAMTSKVQMRPVERVKRQRSEVAQFSVGWDVRGQRDTVDQTVKPQSMPSFSAAYILNHWLFQVEYGHQYFSSGNASLSVDRKFETGMGWVYWQATDKKFVSPFLGGGFGVQHETITTNLLGSSETDSSGNYWTYGGAFGVRLFPKSPIWVSAEGRLYKSGHQDPDPQLGGLLRLGFVIR